MYSYIHTREIASFSKEDFLFEIQERREEHPRLSAPSTIRYWVQRAKLEYGEPVSGTTEIVQENLTVNEIIRHLANAAEDGSIMKE